MIVFTVLYSVYIEDLLLCKGMQTVLNVYMVIMQVTKITDKNPQYTQLHTFLEINIYTISIYILVDLCAQLQNLKMVIV